MLLHLNCSASRNLRTVLQILEAQQRIAAGQQFATVAGEMSEDKARQGGDLGWKRRQEVVGAFADAAFKLEVRIHQYTLHASLHQLGHFRKPLDASLWAACVSARDQAPIKMQ